MNLLKSKQDANLAAIVVLGIIVGVLLVCVWNLQNTVNHIQDDVKEYDYSIIDSLSGENAALQREIKTILVNIDSLKQRRKELPQKYKPKYEKIIHASAPELINEFSKLLPDSLRNSGR